MTVYVVLLYGSLDSIWSTRQKAEIQSKWLEREEGDGGEIQEWKINQRIYEESIDDGPEKIQ